MELRGKTALVTGAARRIGRAIALRLARGGCDILLHYNRSSEDAQKTRSEIESLGVGCRLLRADLGRASEILRMISEIDGTKEKIGILVNSASLFYKTPLESAGEKEWDELLNANLKAPFLLSKELGLRMKRTGGGKIVNIADWSGFRPYRDYSPYCVSKGGLLTLTKSLARDLAPSVAVNAVAPGPVLAPPDMSEEEKKKAVEKTPLGRWGKPEDVAEAVGFLVESDFINGTVLVVDGGRSIV